MSCPFSLDAVEGVLFPHNVSTLIPFRVLDPPQARFDQIVRDPAHF
jgi:hypothetical protein